MNTLLVTARAVHFTSVILLFGGLMFALFIARRASDAFDLQAQRFSPARRWSAFWSLALSAVSGAAWLAAEAASMSGLPLRRAMTPGTLGLVLGQTTFGRLWVLRFILAIAIGFLLMASGRSTNPRRRWRLELGAFVVTGVYLATLAWTGHAAAGQGSERFVHVITDVVHLLAAGAWLGALPGLVFLLGRARTLEAAAQATARFSVVGMISVGALLLSGFINTWYLVGSVPALVGTDYGQLLLVKLSLFVLMVSLAAFNRLRLTPRLHSRDPEARLLLRRNAILEIVAGLGVVAVVAALGASVPGAHQSVVWPFSRTLSWEPAENAAAVRWSLVAAAVLAVYRCRSHNSRRARSAAKALGRRNRRHCRGGCCKRAAACSSGVSDHLRQVAGALHDHCHRPGLFTVCGELHELSWSGRLRGRAGCAVLADQTDEPGRARGSSPAG